MNTLQKLKKEIEKKIIGGTFLLALGKVQIERIKEKLTSLNQDLKVINQELKNEHTTKTKTKAKKRKGKDKA